MRPAARPRRAQRPAPALSEGELAGELFKACDEGRLEGGLSVALDVRPEELVGPLTLELGGAARRLKILDVRGEARVELTLQLGEVTERWELEDLGALVHNLNDLFRADREVKVAAVLGEWEDMLQLWCVPKAELPKLLEQRFFWPRNRAQLEAIAG